MVPVLALALLMSAALLAQSSSGDFMIYPAKGQNAEQQKKDEFECYSWAKEQSGFDPMATYQTTSAPPEQQQTKASAGRGALGGAAAGAVIGGVASNDAGKGAAIGAASGALFGGARRSKKGQQQQAEQEQWAQKEGEIWAQQKSNYNRAHSACLEGRGYTVK
jgi:outer membrane lipoprotein SlyB